jgi:hypothetical protein
MKLLLLLAMAGVGGSDSHEIKLIFRLKYTFPFFLFLSTCQFVDILTLIPFISTLYDNSGILTMHTPPKLPKHNNTNDTLDSDLIGLLRDVDSYISELNEENTSSTPPTRTHSLQTPQKKKTNKKLNKILYFKKKKKKKKKTFIHYDTFSSK